MSQILFVDDDEFVATLYKNKLEQEGYRVTVVLEGQQALEILNTLQPDAIILDLHLPDITGTELLQTIRSTEALKDTPVLVLSTGYVKSLMDEVSPLEVEGIFIKSQSPPRVIIAELKKILPAPSQAAPTQNPQLLLANIGTPAPLKTFMETDDEEDQRAALRQFYLEIRELLVEAFRVGEQTQRGQLAKSFQALLEDLYDNPQRISPSTKTTLALAYKLLRADTPNQRARALPEPEVMLRGIIATLKEGA